MIQVVDVAFPPERKSKPAKALIAIVATLLAGFVFLVWVFVKEIFVSGKGRPEEAEVLLPKGSKLRVVRVTQVETSPIPVYHVEVEGT